MDLGIRGRRALILGGSRGIGRAVAGTLAAEGANLAVCARKGWAARRVASEAAGGWGVEAAGYCIDAWDESSAAALVDRITGELGAVDLLFGVARRPALEDRHRLSWKERLDDGFLRFRATTETLLSGMKDRQWGRVLWMIPWPAPGTSAERQLHSVTGAALSAWLETVAAEVAGDNVALNVLKPAPVSRTSGSDPSGGCHAPPAGCPPPPTDGLLSVPDVAAVAAFLLSDPAGALCGKTIELGRGAGSGQPGPAAARRWTRRAQ